jgi:hypothetical protein
MSDARSLMNTYVDMVSAMPETMTSSNAMNVGIGNMAHAINNSEPKGIWKDKPTWVRTGREFFGPQNKSFYAHKGRHSFDYRPEAKRYGWAQRNGEWVPVEWGSVAGVKLDNVEQPVVFN